MLLAVAASSCWYGVQHKYNPLTSNSGSRCLISKPWGHRRRWLVYIYIDGTCKCAYATHSASGNILTIYSGVCSSVVVVITVMIVILLLYCHAERGIIVNITVHTYHQPFSHINHFLLQVTASNAYLSGRAEGGVHTYISTCHSPSQTHNLLASI